jgi:hypothetical protein
LSRASRSSPGCSLDFIAPNGSPLELTVGWADQDSMMAASSQLSGNLKAFNQENSEDHAEIAEKIVLVVSSHWPLTTTTTYVSQNIF